MQLEKILLITILVSLMISTAQATTTTNTPTSAYDDSGNNVLTKVSSSDNNYAQLTVSRFSSPHYIESNWTNANIPAQAAVTSVIYSFEHYESSTTREDITIELWDGSSWVQVCDPSERTSEGTDSCDLSSYITTPSQANNIAIRYKDTDTGGGSWFSSYSTYLDYENIQINYQINHAPTQDNPILNSTYGTNKTNENLTCYNQSTYDADGDIVKNIYNWFKNGTPITLLNMPFEGTPNSTYVRDYSTYGNNADKVVNATWLKTGGYDGRGAYSFDNTAESTAYIRVPNSTSLVLKNTGYTITAWIYPKSFGDNNYGRIVEKSDAGNTEGTIFYLNNYSGQETLRLYHANGNTYSYADAVNNAVKLNQWQHVAVTVKNNEVHFYVNGQDVTLNHTIGNMTEDTNDSLYIGDEPSGSRTFNGIIDDVMIFNDSLSQQQIQAIYENKTNTIVSQELAANQTWQCCITPNDGIVDGETKCSNNLTTVPAPSITIAKQQYYNCNPTMYYQVKFYDTNGNLVQEQATYSIYNPSGILKNSTQGTATNGVYRGSFYLFGNYQLGEWKLRASTDCYLYQKNFTVTEHLTSEVMKINLYTIPSKIIYNQGEQVTAKFQAIDANGEGLPGLGSKIKAAVDSTPLTLTDDGDGWYSATIDTTSLSANNFHVIEVTATNSTATIVNSKSFYLKG